ncbi:MAG: 2-phospho-L-lactate guanylyltransferase [Colwellia sp.]
MINIVIPMKDPRFSKQRLSPIFDENERFNFALELFKTNLNFLQRNFSQHHILVVTNSEYISKLSANLETTVLIEEKDGLSKAISAAAKWSQKHHFEKQIVIPADIAQLDVNEIETLLAFKIDKPTVLICPSQDNGTNALLTSPPSVIPFCYGPNSAEKHKNEAEKLGVYNKTMTLTKLSIDVDFPNDLQKVINTIEISTLMERIYL